MRLHKNKSEFVLYDIIDDFRGLMMNKNNREVLAENYFYTWYGVRRKIYGTNGFKISLQTLSKFAVKKPQANENNNNNQQKLF